MFLWLFVLRLCNWLAKVLVHILRGLHVIQILPEDSTPLYPAMAYVFGTMTIRAGCT